MIWSVLIAGAVLTGQIGQMNQHSTPPDFVHIKEGSRIDKLLPEFSWEGHPIFNVLLILLNVYLLDVSAFKRILIILPQIVLPLVQNYRLPFGYTHQLTLLFGIWTDNYLVFFLSALKLAYDCSRDTLYTTRVDLTIYTLRTMLTLNVLPFFYFLWMGQLKILPLLFFLFIWLLHQKTTHLYFNDHDTWDPISESYQRIKDSWELTMDIQHAVDAEAVQVMQDAAMDLHEWEAYDRRTNDPDRMAEARYQGYLEWKKREESRTWRHQKFEDSYDQKRFNALVQKHDESAEGWKEYYETQGNDFEYRARRIREYEIEHPGLMPEGLVPEYHEALEPPVVLDAQPELLDEFIAEL